MRKFIIKIHKILSIFCALKNKQNISLDSKKRYWAYMPPAAKEILAQDNSCACAAAKKVNNIYKTPGSALCKKTKANKKRFWRFELKASATVEIAIIMPAIVMLLTLLLQSGILAIKVIKVSEAAGAAARAASRGESSAYITETAYNLSGGQADISYNSDKVCINVIASSNILFIPLDISQKVCTLQGGL